MRFEEGSEFIGYLITLFAMLPIPAARSVTVAASVVVFTSLLSDILFYFTKFILIHLSQF